MLAVMVVSLVIFSVLAFIMGAFLKGILICFNDSDQSKVSMGAKVLSLRQEITTKECTSSKIGAKVCTKYYVSFNVRHEVVKEFVISLKKYASIEEGEQGTLTYRGDEFLDFKRDLTRHVIEDEIDNLTDEYYDKYYNDEYNDTEDKLTL